MQKNTSRYNFRDLGRISYSDAWDYQEKLFQDVIARKLDNGKISETERRESINWLLFCEHPHVLTIGKSGKAGNLLATQSLLQAKNVSFIKTNRGGDITYHGPGQIVGYPIFDLDTLKLGIRDYIHSLEETVILTLAEFGIKGGRINGATGVWLEPSGGLGQRKICAIGVRTSRWVTMHGFALNVNTDLSYFNLINPCGFTDKTVTSLEKETGQKQEIEKVKFILKEKFSGVFGIDLAASNV